MSRASVFGWLRLLCGGVLIGWLLWQAAGHEAIGQLRTNPPDLATLAIACIVLGFAVVFSFTRWWLVSRAAGIAIPYPEAIRLGAIGFACNFVALGSIGGDVVKATLLAKPRPGKRAAAVTTILVDRLLGLLGFLLYASTAVLVTGTAFTDESSPLQILCQTILLATGVSIAGFLIPMAPGRPLEKLAGMLSGLPLVGPLAEKAGELASVYHDGRRSLLAALAAGLVMNGLFILSFYFAARSLALPIPTLAEHYLVVPLVAICGTLPISPNGLGTIEAAAEYLYRALQPDAGVGTGTLAALAHRMAMIAMGVLSAGYYYAAGGLNLDEAMNEATPNNETASVEGSGTPAEPA